MKLIQKIKEVGVKNMLVGSVKSLQYRGLMRKYHFSAWHLSPYEWREYIQVCAKYINAHDCRTVVDIGCGLGGLLQHVKAENRVGMDKSEALILAARELDQGKVTFKVGSFDELTEKPIDYLVTLNFMHGGAEECWIEPYHMVAERNDVQHFIVDTVPARENIHSLDWSRIMPANYTRLERFGPFLSGRYVEVWGKQQTP